MIDVKAAVQAARTYAQEVPGENSPTLGSGIPLKDYLSAVLSGMSRRKYSAVAQLTPAQWTPSRT